MRIQEVFVTLFQGNKVTKKIIKAEQKPIKEAEEERKERRKKGLFSGRSKNETGPT